MHNLHIHVVQNRLNFWTYFINFFEILTYTGKKLF